MKRTFNLKPLIPSAFWGLTMKNLSSTIMYLRLYQTHLQQFQNKIQTINRFVRNKTTRRVLSDDILPEMDPRWSLIKVDNGDRVKNINFRSVGSDWSWQTIKERRSLVDC